MKIKYVLSPDARINEYNEFIIEHFHEFVIEKEPDIILVAGGDGAMLHAMHDNRYFDGIFLGKGLGTLNFLMNDIKADKLILQDLVSDKQGLHVEETNSIAVYLDGVYHAQANNDVIIGDTIQGYHTIKLTTSDKAFNEFEFKGGGICISTPLGSTAFNFNNGGMILPLTSNEWILTGVVCNHMIKDILQEQEMQIFPSGGKLFVDGIESADLKKGSLIELKPGRVVKLGFLDGSDFRERRVTLANRYRKG